MQVSYKNEQKFAEIHFSKIALADFGEMDFMEMPIVYMFNSIPFPSK